MKKLLLILAALFAAFLPIHSVANLSAQETEELNMQDMDNGWSSTYDAATRTITFTAAWGGRGWWLGRDLSDYTKVVAEFATPAPCGGVMKVDYGDNTSAEQGYEVGATSVELVLDEAKKAMVNKIYFSASEAGQLAFKTVYLVKAGASQPGVGEVTEELNMQDMDNGWSSTYDATTRTITFEAAWGGRGWWLGRDLSDYTKVVAELAAPAPCGGVMKVDYGDNTSAEQGYEAGATSVEILLDDAKKVMVNKIYFSASEAGQLAFKTVYLVKAGASQPGVGEVTEELNMQDMDNGWSSTYDAATRTITFEAAWGGRGWWLGRDLSGYTKVVAEFAAPAPCGGVMKVDYGDNTSAEQGYEVGATGVEILLDEAKKVMVNKIYFSASEAGKLAFKTVYLVKVAGGNDDPVEEGEHEALSLSAMDYGWSSSYDAATQTVKIESAWAARGWLLNKDLSAYTKVVVEFAVATPCGGVLKAEYAEEQYNEQGFETGAQRVELVLDETHKSHVVGIFFSTPEVANLVIKSAYLVKSTSTDVENILPLPTDGVYYNILGQQVAYPTRGNIYIHNGKKVIYQ